MSDLIRIVAIAGTCVLDVDRRLPGRGAHLHPTEQCLDRAVKRRAFPRALRVAGPLDLSSLREAIRTVGQSQMNSTAPRGIRPEVPMVR